ncbi:hypothetical protein SeLEV6574_g04173 [Synchytrium endobioticum]|nr:hypothetical protein SeLEV6574_g04173 [Synchytrium endobioticum]
MTLQNIPIISFLTVPWWFAELRGYSKLYTDSVGYPFLVLSAFTFLAFTDMLIYFIHRAEHHPSVYFWLHKPHHLYKIPTPFASHAFHPLDGYLQSIPYHIYIFLFPLHSWLYLGLFVFVNVWTISIHDGAHLYGGGILNGTAHHTIHHAKFNYNYGQYFTLWDRIGGSYRYPEEEYKKHMMWQRVERKMEIDELNTARMEKEQMNGHANGNGAAGGLVECDSSEGYCKVKINGHATTAIASKRSARRRE